MKLARFLPDDSTVSGVFAVGLVVVLGVLASSLARTCAYDPRDAVIRTLNDSLAASKRAAAMAQRTADSARVAAAAAREAAAKAVAAAEAVRRRVPQFSTPNDSTVVVDGVAIATPPPVVSLVARLGDADAAGRVALDAALASATAARLEADAERRRADLEAAARAAAERVADEYRAKADAAATCRVAYILPCPSRGLAFTLGAVGTALVFTLIL